MENLVPLGTGNSRFMKSNISPSTTLAQLISMLNNGTFPYDVGTINPAGISQQGTPLNKDTLLKDATAGLYGLGSDAVPDDVFNDIYSRLIMIAQDKARLIVTVKDASGAPIPNTLISGLQDESGSSGVLTNENGVATGYADEGTANISVSGFADLVDKSVSQAVQKGITYNIDLSVETRNFLKITSSGNYKFSGRITRVDVTVVGGGAGGNGGYCRSGSSSGDRASVGGGGGYCVVQENVDFSPNTLYGAVIGAGGRGGTGNAYDKFDSEFYGENGGSSSFLGVTANGGSHGTQTSGGAGNGRGGNVTGSAHDTGGNGVAGSVYGYSSFTETVLYGGGGGAGYGGKGGADFGGDGATSWNSPPTTVQANTGGGGGGGLGDGGRDDATNGGDGGSGVIALRMHTAA